MCNLQARLAISARRIFQSCFRFAQQTPSTPNRDKAKQTATKQDKPGQSRQKGDKAGQTGTKQAGQTGTKQAGQTGTKRDKAGPTGTSRNKAGQSRTKQAGQTGTNRDRRGQTGAKHRNKSVQSRQDRVGQSRTKQAGQAGTNLDRRGHARTKQAGHTGTNRGKAGQNRTRGDKAGRTDRDKAGQTFVLLCPGLFLFFTGLSCLLCPAVSCFVQRSVLPGPGLSVLSRSMLPALSRFVPLGVMLRLLLSMVPVRWTPSWGRGLKIGFSHPRAKPEVDLRLRSGLGENLFFFLVTHCALVVVPWDPKTYHFKGSTI